MSERRPMGGLEKAVLDVVWKHPQGATPAEVLQAMDSQLAYTTVMTTLTRLWHKELIGRERRGRAYAYKALVSEEELAVRRMRAALDPVSNRPAALAHFVDSLSSRDAASLRTILDRLDGGR